MPGYATPEALISQLSSDSHSFRPRAALLKDARPDVFASTSYRRCICFGLGSLRDSPKSQLQLALLQDLLAAFEVIQTLRR